MDARDLIRTIARNWLLILSGILLSTSVAALMTIVQKPMYQATSAVFVSTRSATSAQDLTSGVDFSQQLVTSFETIARSPYILNPVRERLGLDTSTDALAQRISVDVPVNTAVMQISVEEPSPTVSAEIANAVAQQLTVAVSSLTPNPEGQAPTVRVTQIRSAGAPAFASSPRLGLNLALGLMVGLLVGLVAVVVRERVDTRVRTVRELARLTSHPLLGQTTFSPRAAQLPISLDGTNDGAYTESFRTLRTNLNFVGVDGKQKVFVFTSSIEGEGKTTTVGNLGIAAAAAGQKVLVLDADLRKPRIADFFGLESAIGLTDLLIGTVDLGDAVQSWGPSALHVLPAGQLPPNPSELLGSDAYASLIKTLANEYDLVLIDAPPLLPVADATILSARSSGSVLVAAVGRVRRGQLELSLAALVRSAAPILGIVAAMVPPRDTGSYGYGAYGYGYSGNGKLTQ